MKKILKAIFSLPVLILRILFVLLFLFLLSGIVSFFWNQSQEPSVDNAPWAIQTYTYVQDKSIPSRVYYGEEYAHVDGEPALKGYWEYDGKNYHFNGDVKIFNKDDWGPVAVIRR